MASIYYVRLGWTDNSDNETGFDIFRGYTAESIVKIGEVAAEVEEYSDHGADDEGLLPHARYYYQVRSKNAAGAASSEIIDVRILDYAPQGAPVVSLASQADGAVNISWTPVTGATGYHVIVQDTNFPLNLIELDDVTNTAATFDGINSNGALQFTEYKFFVQAFNEFGDAEAGNGILTMTTDVWVPDIRAVSLQQDDAGRILARVSFNPVWNPAYSRVHIEASIGDQVSWYRPADGYQNNSAFPYVETLATNGLPDGTVVYFRLVGMFTDGHPTNPTIYAESAPSDVLVLTIDLSAVEPNSPTSLAAASIPYGVRLTWVAPTVGVPNAYVIYFFDGVLEPVDYTDMTIVGQVDGATLTFDHIRDTEEADGWYMVAAVNEAGEGHSSMIQGISGVGQVDLVLIPIQGHGVLAAWYDASGVETEYDISVRESAFPDVFVKIYSGDPLDPDTMDSHIWYPSIVPIGPAYSHDGTHVNRIRLAAMSGAVIDSSESIDYTWPVVGPSLPEITSITQDQGDVMIEWSVAHGSFQANPATMFRIWRETQDSQQRIQVATLPGYSRAFLDRAAAVNGPAYNSAYLYWVEAFTLDSTIAPHYSLPSLITTGGLLLTPDDLFVWRMDSEVELRWTADQNANHFHVYRSLGDDDYSLIGEAGVSGVYIDNTVEQGEHYEYQITGVLPLYETPRSNTAYADLDGKLPMQNYTLEWYAVPSGRDLITTGTINFQNSWPLGGLDNKRVEIYATLADEDPFDGGTLCQMVTEPDGASGAFISFWLDEFVPGSGPWIISAVAMRDGVSVPQGVGQGRSIFTGNIFPDNEATDVDDLAVSYNGSSRVSTLTWTNTGATRTHIRVYGTESEYFNSDLALYFMDLGSVGPNDTTAFITNQPNDKQKRYMIIYWDEDTNSETGRSNVVIHGRTGG